MKVMFDANIIIDVFQMRNGFYSHSAQALNAIESGFAIGFIPASTMTDIFYVARKSTGSKARAYEAIELVKAILQIANVSDAEVTTALTMKANDFEDCILANCAKSNECDYIITRNKKDFKNLGVETLTPLEFIALIP